MNTDSHPGRKYIHKTSYNRQERVVGFFVFSAFIVCALLFIIISTNQHLFEQRVIYYMDVGSSEGISQGSIVKALGREVGVVSALNLTHDRKIRITIEVYQDSQTLIRSGAKAIVNRLANISEALIEIKSDSIDAPVLADGSILPVEETPSLNDLLLGIAYIIQSAEKHDLLTKFETLLPKLELTMENAYKIIAQIATGRGVLGAAVFDEQVEKELKSVVSSSEKVLQEAKDIVHLAKLRLIQLEPLLNDASYITHDIRGATQNLPALIAELNEIITQANAAMSMINAELEQIPGTVIDARRALNKTNRLIDSAQSTWPLSKDLEEKPVSSLIPLQPAYD